MSPVGGMAMEFGPGDQIGATALADARPLIGRPFVTGVAVAASDALPVIVAFGDSLTYAMLRSETQCAAIPRCWRDDSRPCRSPGARRWSMRGSARNRVLADGLGVSALARLDRDALRIEGVSHLILLEGINDIGSSGKAGIGESMTVTADDLIAGYCQIIARAHARQIKVIGGTLTPFRGAGYYTADRDAVRLAVNRWIRTGGAFDGVIDFEATLRDPADSSKLRADYDSGDHLHLNDNGYRAMGEAIDLGLYRRPVATAPRRRRRAMH